MRTERAAFRDAPETTSSTYLAYQFFGHPGLRLDAGGRLTFSGGSRSRPARASARRRRCGSRDWACAGPEPAGGCGAAPSRRAARGAARTSPFATSERAKARACTAASPSDEVTSPKTPVIDRPPRVVATRAMPGHHDLDALQPDAVEWHRPVRADMGDLAVQVAVHGCQLDPGAGRHVRAAGAARGWPPSAVCRASGTASDVAGAGSDIPCAANASRDRGRVGPACSSSRRPGASADPRR